MAYNANQRVGEYKKSHRKRSVWKRIVAVLGCAVVFCTTYALILPAITQEHTAHCGLEEHTHSVENGCYEKVLICGYNETGTETGASAGAGVEAGTGHVHTDACYEEQRVLTCGLEESTGHVHDDSCTQTEQQLVCSEEHEHSDACYKTVTTTVCGKTEGEGAHTHSESCYGTERVLICGLSEKTAESSGEAHVHTDACYELKLTCQKTEHTHVTACFSDPEADVETAADWEKTFADVKLTGEYWNDVLEIAKTQIGYQESEKNYQVVTNDAGEEVLKGYTRYGAWYGMPYEDWCAMFVSFCLHYAEVPTEVFPQSAGCESWITTLKEKGLYLTTAEYRSEEHGGPYAGDLVFFDWPDEKENYDGISNHVGIVSELLYDENDSETLIGFKTIEGNSGDKVTDKKEYFFLDENGEENKEILGFGLIPREDIVLKAEGADYTITVRYTEEAQLPEDTRLEVREILPGTEEYESYASQAAQAMNEEEGAVTRRFFDITLMSGEEEEAVEVEPLVPVNVTISLAEAQPTGEDTVVHFPQEGEVELIPATADSDGVHYEQPGFSTVGVTATAAVIPAQTYSQSAQFGNNFEYTRTIRVGDTVEITVEDPYNLTYWYTPSWGTPVVTPDSGFVSASFNDSSRVLTINGLANSGGETVEIKLMYSYESYSGTQTITITVNLIVRNEGEMDYTSNRYNHLDVNVDTNFSIHVYDANGNVTTYSSYGTNPTITNVEITALDARVYHTRPTEPKDPMDNSERQTGTTMDSVEQEWAYMKDLVGGVKQKGYYTTNQQNTTKTWVPSDTGSIEKWVKTDLEDNATITTLKAKQSYGTRYIETNAKIESPIYDYIENDTFNGQTVASYGVIYEANIKRDTTTTVSGSNPYQFMSEGRVANGSHYNRLPLAMYDGDTVVLTATIQYTYNNQTYTAEYEIVHVVNFEFNTFCTNRNNQEQRGYDLILDVEDIVEMAPTYVQKVDQYGNPISGATLAVYATDENYQYLLDGTNNPVTLTTGQYSIDEQTGVITLTGGGTITPKDTGTTDNQGQYTWKYDTEPLVGVTMTMTGLKNLIDSDYFIMREIGVPDGYRTVSDEIKLQFKTAGTEALSTVMVCNNSYESGVWAGANAHVEAPQTLYTANAGASPQGNGRQITYWSNTGTDIQTNGTLFAVVLKRNTEGSNIDDWYPLYGSDDKGYTVEATNDLAAVIDAAQKSQAYGSTVFKKGDSGMNVIANLYNLPADITRYYTYMYEADTIDWNEKVNYDPQYVVAYYWTSENVSQNGWGAVTESNTYRVISHSGVDTDLTDFEEFSIQWGTTIQVPNMENRLYFQKRDQALSTSADTGLIDNAVFALYPAVSAAQAGDTTSNLCYYLGEERETKSVAYIIPYTPTTTGYEPDNPYKAAVFGSDGNGGVKHIGDGYYSFNKDGITIDAYGSVSGGEGEIGLMTVEIKNGDTTTYYVVHPATNADGNPLVSATHDTCPTISEVGTGHFNKLKTGNYLLREIAAPDGYALNNTDIPVVVNNIGVYANAGTETDGVSVGNGIGYLSKTIDVFASLNHIDETLAWVYGALLRSDATGFTAFDNVVHDVIHAESLEHPNTGWSFVKHVDGDLIAYGTGNTDNRSEAMVSYFEYNGSLTDQGKTPIFDYTPNDDTQDDVLVGQAARTMTDEEKTTTGVKNFVPTQTGQTLNGAGLNRLWTKTGWSDMAIYQDFAYGNVKNPTTTHYTDLTNYGNISNLFSSSTFVTVTDQPIINEAQVDVGVSKIALNTVTGEDGTETSTSSSLAGAAFRLYKLDGENKSYYAYNAESSTTSWVGENGTYTTLTSDATGALNDVFHNLPNGTYYLEEVTTPNGHTGLNGPITITVDIQEGTSASDIVKVSITYGENIYSYSYDSSAAQVETKPENNTSGFDVTSRVTTEARTDGTAGFKGTYLYTITVPNQVKPVVNVGVNKVKEDGQTALAGAEFQLYRLDTDGTTKLYYAYNATNGTTWGEQPAATTLTSGPDGTLNGIFHELEDINEREATSYYLVETKAPDGYNLLTQPIKIDVEVAGSSAAVEISVGETKLYSNGSAVGNTGGYSVSAEKSGRTYLYTLTVPNSTGYELPHTGGSGTLTLTLLGLTLATVGCCGLYGWRKRGGAA